MGILQTSSKENLTIYPRNSSKKPFIGSILIEDVYWSLMPVLMFTFRHDGVSVYFYLIENDEVCQIDDWLHHKQHNKGLQLNSLSIGNVSYNSPSLFPNEIFSDIFSGSR